MAKCAPVQLAKFGPNWPKSAQIGPNLARIGLKKYAILCTGSGGKCNDLEKLLESINLGCHLAGQNCSYYRLLPSEILAHSFCELGLKGISVLLKYYLLMETMYHGKEFTAANFRSSFYS